MPCTRVIHPEPSRKPFSLYFQNLNSSISYIEGTIPTRLSLTLSKFEKNPFKNLQKAFEIQDPTLLKSQKYHFKNSINRSLFLCENSRIDSKEPQFVRNFSYQKWFQRKVSLRLNFELEILGYKILVAFSATLKNRDPNEACSLSLLLHKR